MTQRQRNRVFWIIFYLVAVSSVTGFLIAGMVEQSR